MKTLTKPFNAATVIFVIILICVGLIWQATRTGEAGNPHRIAAFGMFGVTTAQIARLNVANVCAPTDPCRTRIVRLSFIDANGSTGGGSFDSPQMQTTVSLAPGGSAYFDIQGSDVVISGNRAQIRALVEDLGSPNGVPPNPVVPTLEVIDAATGATTVLAPVDPCRMTAVN